MSFTKTVESEFKLESSVDMAAARMPAMINPENPTGTVVRMKYGNTCSASMAATSGFGNAWKYTKRQVPMKKKNAHTGTAMMAAMPTAFRASRWEEAAR